MSEYIPWNILSEKKFFFGFFGALYLKFAHAQEQFIVENTFFRFFKHEGMFSINTNHTDIHLYIYICSYINLCIYLYGVTEEEKLGDRAICGYIYIHTYIHTYIFIAPERARRKYKTPNTN